MIRTQIILILLAALLPATARAGAYEDLLKVETAFQNAKSWRAVEQFSNGRSTTVEYVAPDRWLMQSSPKQADVIIGNDVYTVSNGKSTRLPFGGSIIRHIIERYSKFGDNNEIRATAQDLGMQTLDGQSVHVYSFKSHGSLATLYVGADSLPVENVARKGNKTIATITYSEYNQPIDIEP